MSRWLGAVGALGGLLWILGWRLDHIPEFLTEGQSRAFVNPALLLLLPLPWMFRHASNGRDGRLGLAGTVLTSAGLLGELAGNFLEYGWWNNRITVLGYAVLAGSHVPVLAGALLLALAALRARVLPAWLAASPLLLIGTVGISAATGLMSPDLDVRQPAFEGLLMGTGASWMVMGLGLLGMGKSSRRGSSR